MVQVRLDVHSIRVIRVLILLAVSNPVGFSIDAAAHDPYIGSSVDGWRHHQHRHYRLSQ